MSIRARPIPVRVTTPPYPVYREGAVSGLDAYRYRRHYAPYHGRRYGHREHVLRRYY